MLHLVFHIPHSKPANHATFSPKFRCFHLPDGELGALGCYKTPRPFSNSIALFLSLSIYLPLCVSFSLLHVLERNNMEIGCTAERRQGAGWEGKEEMTGRRVGCGAKFKNISNCQMQGWAAAVQQHTFNFSYFCCFFHNV